jgi:hypothetical protein
MPEELGFPAAIIADGARVTRRSIHTSRVVRCHLGCRCQGQATATPHWTRPAQSVSEPESFAVRAGRLPLR